MTGRPIRIRNEHKTPCNSHLYPIRNQSWNVLIPQQIRNVATLPAFKVAEVVPIRMQCEVHPWMKAWLLVLDHPYAAVTTPDGRFQINWLPEGDHELWVWHERTGYIEKKLPVCVRNRKVTRCEPFSFGTADMN